MRTAFCLLALLVAVLAASGCGGGRSARPPAPAPKAEVPALSAPPSALSVYLAERKAIAAGKVRAATVEARGEIGREREERFAQALARGTALLAQGRPADAVAELSPVAAAPNLPPERQAEALLALSEAYAASGEPARAAQARESFNEAMRKSIEAAREAESRERFAGILLGQEIITKEGGDPDAFFAPVEQ